MNIRSTLRIVVGLATLVAILLGMLLYTAFNRMQTTTNRMQNMDRLIRSVFELKIVTSRGENQGKRVIPDTVSKYSYQTYEKHAV